MLFDNVFESFGKLTHTVASQKNNNNQPVHYSDFLLRFTEKGKSPVDSEQHEGQ